MLVGADMTDSLMVRVDLEGQNLDGWQSWCTKRWCRYDGLFAGVKLERAVCDGANMQKSKLLNTSCVGVSMGMCKLVDQSTIPSQCHNWNQQCLLANVNMVGTEVDSVDLTKAQLQNVEGRSLQLSNVSARKCVLDGSILLKAKVTDSDFEGSSLLGVKVLHQPHSSIACLAR